MTRIAVISLILLTALTAIAEPKPRTIHIQGREEVTVVSPEVRPRSASTLIPEPR